MLFKDISYLELWWPLCLVEQNHCAILVQCIMTEEQFYDHYFEFGPVDQEEMPFGDISYLELWQLFQRSITICLILVEGTMRNNSVKLF